MTSTTQGPKARRREEREERDREERAARGPESGSRLFWRYWTAGTISSTGSAVTLVALPLTAVAALRASSVQVGVLTAAGDVAWILIGLPAGVLVQRLPLRGTQVVMDLLRAAALFSIPLAAAFGLLALPQLIAVALLVGLADVVFDIGNSTFLPSIVGPAELTARNSVNSAGSAATSLGGPALGGVLVQLIGSVATLLVDAVSYLVSAALLRSLPRPAPAQRPAQGVSMAALIRDGWRFVVHHPLIRPCVAAAGVTNFVCGALAALTPLFLVRSVGAPAGLVGVLVATEGVGGLIGAALTPRLAGRLGSARAVLLAPAGGALALVLLPLAGSGWRLLLFGLGNVGFAMGVVVLSTLTRTHRQTVTPAELLPRVMATVRFITWGMLPVGALAAGFAATAFGAREALWLVCLVALAIPLPLWLSPLRGGAGAGVRGRPARARSALRDPGPGPVSAP
ncbi:MFS transporter [Kitasatospora sp. NBC_01287]|uniref:MFS transporter n=1 Tax=Kitasatospora sp. NBC_01287 TaxID=2903573 RepID=UPI002259EDCB|nr:MFS transporter [Kitasatospora sp. NBC_01287]MCX4749741.1 MFS transporter [Kitasatospora sp. NBC_01287]